MRRFACLALIALLLLRGWAGDAMATTMATTVANSAITAASSPAMAHQASGHHASGQGTLHHATDMANAHPMPDCAGHAQPADDAPVSHTGSAGCESCAACQACHTVALSPSAPVLTALPAPRNAPISVAVQFASADAALGQKPPIS